MFKNYFKGFASRKFEHQCSKSKSLGISMQKFIYPNGTHILLGVPGSFRSLLKLALTG